MQTKALSLVSGIPRLSLDDLRRSAALTKGTTMSKTASVGFAPSTSLLGRLMASFDRLLMTSARAAVRNGDLPYFGL